MIVETPRQLFSRWHSSEQKPHRLQIGQQRTAGLFLQPEAALLRHVDTRRIPREN